MPILEGRPGRCFDLAFLHFDEDPSLGILISIAALAAMVGGNYWRQHLHVVTRMTPSHLISAAMGNHELVRHRPSRQEGLEHSIQRVEPTRIRLHQVEGERNTRDGAYGFLDKLQTQVLGGYDAILSRDELSCTVDSFVAERHKRLEAVANAPTGPVAEPRRAG